jgi:hypothetical protein
MRGFLEAGAHLKEERYLNGAERVFKSIRAPIKPNGFLPGRFDCNWNPTVRYCCLTGNAQLAINGFRLHQLTGEQHYKSDAKRLLTYVLRTQDLGTVEPNVRGGIAGSYPIKGRYHPYQYPNWAAKFTADAIMMQLKLEENGEKKYGCNSEKNC